MGLKAREGLYVCLRTPNRVVADFSNRDGRHRRRRDRVETPWPPRGWCLRGGKPSAQWGNVWEGLWSIAPFLASIKVLYGSNEFFGHKSASSEWWGLSFPVPLSPAESLQMCCHALGECVAIDDVDYFCRQNHEIQTHIRRHQHCRSTSRNTWVSTSLLDPSVARYIPVPAAA